MYIIKIGARYFSARRGSLGGLVRISKATRFDLADAIERASRTVGATIQPCPDYAAQCLDALQSNQVA